MRNSTPSDEELPARAAQARQEREQARQGRELSPGYPEEVVELLSVAERMARLHRPLSSTLPPTDIFRRFAQRGICVRLETFAGGPTHKFASLCKLTGAVPGGDIELYRLRDPLVLLDMAVTMYNRRLEKYNEEQRREQRREARRKAGKRPGK